MKDWAKGSEMKDVHTDSWRRYFREENSDLHVMPDDDKHECSKLCFCRPSLSYRDDETGKEVWVHKSHEELNK